MPFCTHQPCPDKQCGVITQVYVDVEQIPAMDEAFAYTCPSCDKPIIARFGAYVVVDSIPSNSTVATPSG